MLTGDFIAFPGFQRGAVPVQIIDLELNIIHLRVSSEDGIQKLGAIVVGKADFSGLAGGFARLKEGKFAILFGKGVVFFVEPVEQIYVKILYAATAKGFFQISLSFFPGLYLITGEFIGQLKTVSWVPLHQTAADGFLTGTA